MEPDKANPEARSPKAAARRAVFLDRDGVINRALVREGKPYPPANLEEFEILPGVAEACVKLKAAGFLLVVATNQPDVGRGTLAREAVEAIHSFMVKQLPLDRVEVCYHPGKGQPENQGSAGASPHQVGFHPGKGESECECRKPRPGMLLRAANELAIDLHESWMIGDRWRDIDCGHAAGCRTILVDRGYAEALRQTPDYRTADLLGAAQIILNCSKD